LRSNRFDEAREKFLAVAQRSPLPVYQLSTLNYQLSSCPTDSEWQSNRSRVADEIFCVFPRLMAQVNLATKRHLRMKNFRH
jgi:hypothetical protein